MKKKVLSRVLVVNCLVVLALLLTTPFVFAAETTQGTDWTAPTTYIKIVGWFILGLSLFITIIPKGKELSQTHKTFFFLLLAVPIVLASLYLAGHTINHNIISETKGPVHWHADYEVWLCGEKVDLIDPTGLKNKIGTPLFHEHNDDRMHVEGTVLKYEHVNLANYFRVIGGELTEDSISFNIEGEGLTTYTNGDACDDGSIGELFVYVNGQRKMNAPEYVISPEVFVPNGDCIIYEFGANLPESTQRICPSWEANEMTYEKFFEIQEVNS